MGDDAEVPNLRRRSEGLVGEAADGNLLVQGRCIQVAEPGPSRVSSARLRDTIEQCRAALMLGEYAPSQWKTFQRFVLKSLKTWCSTRPRNSSVSCSDRTRCSAASSRASRWAWTPWPAPPTPDARGDPAGRPVTSNSVPTAQRARRVVYAPDLDGRADPGEIVWTWVVYEDDPSEARTARCWSWAATARCCSA